MLKIELDYQSLPDVIKRMREERTGDLLMEISESCPFSENLLAFKIIKNEARDLGRKVVFVAKSSGFNSLVETLNDDVESFGFVKGFDFGELSAAKTAAPQTAGSPPPRKFKFRLSVNRDLGFIIAILSGVLILAFYLFFYYLPRATITLVVEAESLVKSIEVTASPSAQSIEVAARVIPATEITANLKKTVSASATGSKEVGDKAKGEVTIYNKTDSSKTFTAKTSLAKGQTQGSDLIYLTDSEILVPSSSSGISGVATTSATAEKIGDEYNLAANNTLTVSNFSTNSMIAENTKSFSGGSRRTITVVTEDDQKRLFSSASSEIEASLISEIKGKLIADQKLEEGSFSFATASKTFDKAISEEASSFNLILEEEARALVYSENELKSLLGEVLNEYVPDGYELFGEDRTVEVISAKYETGNLLFSTKIKGFIVPKIDEKKIKDDLAGLSLNAAKQYLGNLSVISSYQMSSSPNLPGFAFLPRNKQSIKVVITRQ